VDIRPDKTETHRVRLTVGGNLIQYPEDVSTQSSDLTTSKCLWNKYMCLDVKKFYFGTPMDSFEYICIPIKLIPHENSYRRIQLTLFGIRWPRIYCSEKRHVWPAPSRHPRQPTTCSSPSHPWLPSNQVKTRSLAPCYSPHPVHDKLLPLPQPPPCAPARTHGQIQAPREPPN
jgi:hypothetical protein